ncbi:hypothetical protein Y1Q_0004421 [Alligator mississippiensis]|uniref:Uncharacterized protein n=1 Tax=Alligator mississippiensis TaxID=8496 RepID=A0A151MW80_ALLMI|nr:hypothetical protein Y1Q_0004421 [Alligator mississippiensis]
MGSLPYYTSSKGNSKVMAGQQSDASHSLSPWRYTPLPQSSAPSSAVRSLQTLLGGCSLEPEIPPWAHRLPM